ncbi:MULTISPECIES: hypothetical protein [Devosia]|nr:hypothetical protein [Devosia sp.]MDP2779875.1 hypothetical protein [Devosia sp.]HLV84295.1 hypothetical protein [Devosia sp.]
MANEKNFFARAVDAMIAGRELTAKRYVAEFERTYGKTNRPLTKR